MAKAKEHVDFSDAFQRTPEEGVLIEQLAGPRGLDVATPELHAVAFEQAELFFRHHEGRLLDVAFKSEQALEPGLEVVAAPDTAHAGDADVDVLQAQLVGDPLRPMGGMLKGVGEDPGLDLVGDAVGVRAAGPAPLLDEGGHPADLEGAPDFIERVPVVAHDAAGLGDVLQFLGKMQQRELASSTLSQGGHS